jgi:hypothetical protein
MVKQSMPLYWYQYESRAGTVSLTPDSRGGYSVVFQEEDLGSYTSPEAAADDVSGGHTFSPSGGVDFAALSIPEDLSEWE